MIIDNPAVFQRTFLRLSMSCALWSLALSASPLFAATLTYRFFAGKDTAVSSCIISKDSAGTVISTEWRSDTANMVNELRIDISGADRSWKAAERTKGTNVLLVKAGDSLVLSGTFRGKPASRTYALGRVVWKQMMPFDLCDFALSSNESITFTGIALVGPYALKPYTMRARRMAEETVEIRGTPVTTVHIKIAPTGLFSALWHGDYWFRKSDGLFVKSISPGMPGSPGAIMVLVDER
jgi:hypothetical protein